MATFVVCSRCGNVQETAVLNQLPEGWQRSLVDLFCSHCEGRPAGDVLDEEVIYPPRNNDTFDEDFTEGFCEVCRGPCQGH